MNEDIVYVFGTPLDQLFAYTEPPSEARRVSTAWLQILASEGIDILAYLETEIALHISRQQLTWSDFQLRRKANLPPRPISRCLVGMGNRL